MTVPRPENVDTRTPRTPAPRGRIFDIKPFAVHDGPGIRTTVFMKGCSLRCCWCHNPEAISSMPEVGFHPQRCIACEMCVEACRYDAQKSDADGRTFNRALCTACGACVEACPTDALVYHGRTMTVEEVMEEISKDAVYYRHSGGGVTVSGGEPLLQEAFVVALLEACREEGLHTAVDTCGQVQWQAFERVMALTDLFLYDVKHATADRHRELTGTANDRILENLRKLNDAGAPIEVRYPVVPDVNDDRACVEGIGKALEGMQSVQAIRLLAYHDLAGSKYASVGRASTLPGSASPTTEALRTVAGWLTPFGHPVLVNGESTGG